MKRRFHEHGLLQSFGAIVLGGTCSGVLQYKADQTQATRRGEEYLKIGHLLGIYEVTAEAAPHVIRQRDARLLWRILEQRIRAYTANGDFAIRA